ncbi:cyclin-dependent protein kinase inhibitor SMR3-like [Cynara cardunculus var. scolymus]|uniref:cyclin-dependent protein kinase inhibitor SMR3-like n=1 Tax=Cynara cardunculus var. scolymus TaxID=59895 RepID=UPI000D62A0B3|nr:cyclin-dependent protein kinase inhibitor SMR3-like [Cynara cardunculus var. scolymus]
MNSGDQERPECNSPDELGFQEPEDGKNSGLTIKVPSSLQDHNNGDEGFQEDDEPRTPTSSDQKIPVVTTCPPAPRKPKTVARVNNKRKTPSFQRISVDLMVMITAMFSPEAGAAAPVPDHFLAGDLAAGDHEKKIKKANVSTGS